jgi:phosphatidylglycerol:prolipoprotein diacylglycerol transferase
MYPTLYTQHTAMGDVPYNTWGLMITLAFLTASLTAQVRAARVGIDPDKLVGIYVAAIVTGLLGARLLHFLMATPEEFFANPLVYFKIWQGGFAFYGGLILASIVAMWMAHKRGLNVLKVADLIAPVVMLGLAFGRIGCFFAGCCHGMAMPLPADAQGLFSESFSGGQLYWMPHPPYLLELTHHGVGHNDIPVLPTQLYESVAAFTIFVLTSILWRFRRFDGQVMGAMLVLYSIWRPFNESLRGDEIRGVGYFGFLTTSQLISIPVFVVGVLFLLNGFRVGFAPEKPFDPDEELDALQA